MSASLRVNPDAPHARDEASDQPEADQKSITLSPGHQLVKKAFGQQLAASVDVLEAERFNTNFNMSLTPSLLRRGVDLTGSILLARSAVLVRDPGCPLELSHVEVAKPSLVIHLARVFRGARDCADDAPGGQHERDNGQDGDHEPGNIHALSIADERSTLVVTSEGLQ